MHLRQIFGSKRDEYGEWRRLHEEHHRFYCSSNVVRVIISRRLRWAEHVARVEDGSNAFKILTGKTTDKRPPGSPRRRRTMLEQILKN